MLDAARSLTLLEVNMVSNARMKVQTSVKECVGVKQQNYPAKETF